MGVGCSLLAVVGGAGCLFGDDHQFFQCFGAGHTGFDAHGGGAAGGGEDGCIQQLFRGAQRVFGCAFGDGDGQVEFVCAGEVIDAASDDAAGGMDGAVLAADPSVFGPDGFAGAGADQTMFGCDGFDGVHVERKMRGVRAMNGESSRRGSK